MRISTNEFLLGSLDDLLAQQSRASQLNRQIASGQTMLDAADDPAGAGEALSIAGEIQRLSYDAGNAQSAAQTIESGLSVLQQVSALIDQLRQTALEGANTGDTGATRQALVSVAQNGLQQLVQLANSQDPNGAYIFGGSKANVAPFQTLPNGQTVFSGDAATNAIEVAPSLTVPVTVSGQGAFTNIPAGDDGVEITASASNSGSASIVSQGVTSVTQVTAERLAGTQFEVVLSAGPGNSLNYTVTSGAGSPGTSGFTAGSGIVASGSFAAGSDLQFGGLDLKLDGTPAAGDRFVVQTAATTSLFQTIQDLISALQTPQQGQPANSVIRQRIENTIANLSGAQANILSTQAALGSNLTEIKAVQGQNSAASTNAQAQLTNLQSANLPQVIASYSESVTALQAAELAFARIQNLSLFSLIHS
ncbi:MAG: flagellar hook-associated protein FlgL [Stellaceae bacterium]